MPRLESVEPVLMSRDVQRSIEFYQRLGFREMFRDPPTAPKYVGLARDGVELHVQWHDAAPPDPNHDCPNYRFIVTDVDGLFREFQECDALSPTSAVRDTPWGTREFHVHDPDRNGLQFYRARDRG